MDTDDLTLGLMMDCCVKIICRRDAGCKKCQDNQIRAETNDENNEGSEYKKKIKNEIKPTHNSLVEVGRFCLERRKHLRKIQCGLFLHQHKCLALSRGG